MTYWWAVAAAWIIMVVYDVLVCRRRRRAERAERERRLADEDAKWRTFLLLVSERLERDPPDYVSATNISRVATAYYAREALRQSGKLN